MASSQNDPCQEPSELEELVDTRELHSMLKDYFRLTGIPVAISRTDGKNLIAVGKSDICSKFHRNHPETFKHCKESETYLSSGVPPGEFKIYRCKNNMWDVVTPIVIEGKHLANIFTGRFFFAEDEVDYEFFRSQARKHGFDEEAYMKELQKVPFFNEATVYTAMSFLTKLSHVISTLGDRNFQLRKTLAEHSRLLETLQQSQEELRKSEERYREILETIEDGYYEVDLEGNITFCNEMAAKLVGYSLEEFLGMSYRQLYKDPDLVYRTFNRVYRTGKPDRSFTLEMIHKHGKKVYVELSIAIIKNKNGEKTGFRGISRDVTERILFEEQLKYLSFHDQLTGVYNRAYFEEELNRLNHSRKYPVTVISADLDDLKLINDTLGHYTGDLMIKAAATVIKNSLRSSDMVARVGGDEFVAILPGTDSTGAQKVLDRIYQEIENYNKSNPQQKLSLSIGWATASGPGTSLLNVYKNADDLMYNNKKYKNNFNVLYTLSTAIEERDFITWEHARRLSKYCWKIGETAGLSRQKLIDLMLLSKVHDLGKVGISDHILFKKEPLSREDWNIIKQHPEKGQRIASTSSELSHIAELILKHHERWDGKGYPLGLEGEDIPIECRILAVVDAYDAMTSDRPYRNAMSHEEAVEEIKRCAGTQFDPEIADLFASIIHSKE